MLAPARMGRAERRRGAMYDVGCEEAKLAAAAEDARRRRAPFPLAGSLALVLVLGLSSWGLIFILLP